MSEPAAKPINESLRRKRCSRLAAVQGLYNRDITSTKLSIDKHVEQIMQQWRDSIDAKDDEWPSTDMPTRSLLEDLLTGVTTHQDDIDETIKPVVKDNWKTERMSVVMLAILRCATYELKYHKDRKQAIIIDEYVSIASGFFEDQELGYVNSAIQQIAQNIS